jgi:ribosomal-protein-alanine N-acetyltransferase
VQFLLRDSRAEDFDALWKIDQQCFPPDIAYSRLELRFYMRRNSAFSIVGEQIANAPPPASPAPILGFIVAEARRSKVGHIITIDVLSQARRSGLGSQLLSAAEERLRAAGGCGAVYLETAVDNEAAIAFYKKHKYMISKTIPRYYSGLIDAFVLNKQL